MVARTFIIPVTAAPAPGGPDWWQGINGQPAFPSGTWKQICTTPATQVIGNLPSPLPIDTVTYPQPMGYLGTGHPKNIFEAWNGGCVDQASKELILCGNGGDSDYCGNEVYGLDLSQHADSLRWRRIGEPSPNTAIATTADQEVDYYLDGGRKSNHNAFETHFYNGRVWAIGSSSCWARRTGRALWSWNKAIGATGVTGGSLTGTEVSNKPWTRYGNLTANYDFCSAAMDPITGRIWKLGQYFFGGYGYSYFDVNGPKTAPTNFNPGSVAFHNDSYGAKDAASVIANDGVVNLRAWIVVGAETDLTGTLRIGLIDTESGARLGVVTTTWPGGPATFPKHSSLMYRQGALYFASPYRTGGLIGKLVIPTTGSGTAMRPNLAGTWAWTTISATNETNAPPAIGSATVGTFTKCNMVNDMGNGQAAIVTCDQYNAPTYVFKVP